MEKTENFVDVWGIDTNKYTADSDAAQEVEVEVAKSGELGVADVTDEPEKPAEEQGEVKPDAVPGEAEQKVVDEKQDAEEPAKEPVKEGKEDASSKAQEQPVEEITHYEEIAQSLANEDLLDYDEEKEYDFESEKGLKDLINQTVEKKSQQAVVSYKENLGEDARQLLDILEKGGSVKDFQDMQEQTPFADIPLESSDGEDFTRNQQYLVEDWMKIQKYSDEEINETINDYIEGGMLKKQAALAQKKLAKWQEDQNAKMIADREATMLEQQKQEAAQAEEFKESVINTKELSGFQISPKKAEKLYDFITKRDKEGKSEFDKADTAENRLLYAYFAMEGFDKGKLSKEIATKQARTLKKKLSRHSDTNAAPKRSANEVRRTNQDLGNIPWSM